MIPVGQSAQLIGAEIVSDAAARHVITQFNLAQPQTLNQLKKCLQREPGRNFAVDTETGWIDGHALTPGQEDDATKENIYFINSE